MPQTPQKAPVALRTPPRKQRALIIGGGIAGPAMAMFLQRIGIDSTIYEAKEEAAAPAGLFVAIGANGLRVLKRLGVDAKAAARGSHSTGVVLWSGRGKRLGEMRNVRHDDLIAGSLVIRRDDLHQTLREEAISRGIPIEFEKRLSDIDTNARRVVARFEDGTHATGDLLIGCDGVHSKARHIVAPHVPDPDFRELISCGGFAFGSFAAPQLNVFNLTFGTGASFGYITDPSGETFWQSFQPFPGNPTKAELDAITQEEWCRRLQILHGNEPAPIPDIINSSQGTIRAIRLYNGVSVPIWHLGRVVLAGDAAHATQPHLGQGASMALESVMVLAKCLRDIPDIEQAFTAYQDLRKPRTDKMAKLAQRNGHRIAKSNPISIRLRDMILPVVLRVKENSRERDWVLSYNIDWAEKVSA